ncbi:hypothetical protein C4580_01615 [Candidatus Woesearchaeota archaeon]|nr:MAG: hypothetical protein C4580_01615 [Candidatus Woesearchaeota archaeon]
MFVRVKNIKGKQYAYLVENEWTPWGSRQRVTKYLGKTQPLTRYTDTDTQLPRGYQESVRALIIQELKNHGFLHEGDLLKNDAICVHLTNKTVRAGTKNITLQLNEGFLCDHTLGQLLHFAPTDRPDTTAKKLASHALEAGLKLREEHFVHLFEQAKTIKKEPSGGS